MCSALFTLFLLVTILVLSSSSNVYATETATNYNLSGTNKSTGYEYILEDSANFIDDAVKGKLISQMKKDNRILQHSCCHHYLTSLRKH